MIIVNRIGDHISGSVNGKQFAVTYSEEKLKTMNELAAQAGKVETVEAMAAIVEKFLPLTVESYKELVETKTPYIMVNKATNRYYLRYGNRTSSKALPQVFVDRILQSLDKNIDITPLIKFWTRFLRCPNYSDKKAELLAEYINAPFLDKEQFEFFKKEGFTDEIAVERATTTQVAITMEGLMVGYKVSAEVKVRYEMDENEDVKVRSRYGKEVDPDTGEVTDKTPEFAEERLFEPLVQRRNGDPFFSVAAGANGIKPNHFIRVGNVHYLENWDQVDCNDDRTCVKGLHVGGLRYIEGYRNQKDAVTHNVLIDPMDIGAIVGLGYGNDGAMRVRRYYVVSSFVAPNKNIYHSSRYAQINDTEFAVMVQEAVAKTESKKDALDREANELAGLV